MNSTELLNEIKNQLELLKHKGYDKNSFKSGYLLGYAKALQLQQTGVMQSVLFEDDLVTYETALLAWEKGFNIDCGWKIRKLEDGSFTYTNCSKLGVEQPTQSLLKKWLREKHNIHVNNFCEIWSDLHHNYHSKINFQKDGFWEWFIPTKGKDNLSYKDALEIGLYQCLQLVH